MLLRPIGQGSYGEVWLARSALGTHRAVKIVYRNAFDSARPYEREFSGIQRFEPISRSHDGLVDILQVGRNDESGCFYYVMELADSAQKAAPDASDNTTFASLPTAAAFSEAEYLPRTLAADLRTHTRLPVPACLPIFLNLATALGHLHRHGLVHRDIKPSNIIFVNGTAKLADIGLVAEATEAASFVGTEGFIPPEGPGTRQADIYSLGKVFYEVATGKDRTEFPSLPVTLENFEQHADLLELNAVIVKACASDWRQRYQSAEELASDLALLQSGRSVKRMRQVEMRLAHLRRVAVAAAVITALALGLGAVARFQAARDRSLRDRAERAELEARGQLWRARLNEARALRRSGQAGARSLAIAALRDAARVRVDTELRSEAAACLAMLDLRHTPAAPAIAAIGLSNRVWAPTLDRFLEVLPDASIRVSSASNRTVLCQIPGGRRKPDRLLRFSPGGRWVFVVYDDGNDAVWDTTIPGGGDVLTFPFVWQDYSFSDDDRYASFAGTNGVVHCIELVSRRDTPVEIGATNLIARLSPDASKLLVAQFIRSGGDFVSRIEVRDRVTGKQQLHFDLPLGLLDLVWVDARRFAMVASDDVVRVRDMEDAVPEIVFGGHKGRIVQVGALPGTDWFLTRSWDGTRRLWDLHGGGEALRELSGDGWVGFDPRTRALLGEDERTHEPVRTEIVGDSVVRRLRHPRVAAPNGPFVGNFDVSNSRFISGDIDGIRVWDTDRGRLLLATNLLHSATFHATRDSIVGELGDDSAEIPWRVEASGTWIFGEPRLLGTGPCSYLRFGPAGPLGWVGPASPNRVSFHIRPAGATNELRWVSGEGEIPWNASAPAAFGVSPDARWFAVSGRFENRAWLFESRTGRRLTEFTVRWGAQVTFTPDSRQLLVGDEDEYRLWDIERGQQVWSVGRPPSSNLFGRQAFTADGAVIAVTADRNTVWLLRTSDGALLLRLDHPMPEHVSGLNFSQDSSFLAVINETHITHLWDLRALRRELGTLGFGWEPGLEGVGRADVSPSPGVSPHH